MGRCRYNFSDDQRATIGTSVLGADMDLDDERTRTGDTGIDACTQHY